MMNLVGFYETKSVERGFKVINLLFQTFDSQDLISNSPYCLQDFCTAPYNCETKVIYCFRHRFLSVIQVMYA